MTDGQTGGVLKIPLLKKKKEENIVKQLKMLKEIPKTEVTAYLSQTL